MYNVEVTARSSVLLTNGVFISAARVVGFVSLVVAPAFYHLWWIVCAVRGIGFFPFIRPMFLFTSSV